MGGKTVEHSFPRWYQIGAAGTRDPTLLKCLVTSARGITNARYDSFESPRGTDYQVPAGKTFYITKIQGFLHAAATVNGEIDIGYGDDAVNNSASAPTSAKVVYSMDYVSLGRFEIDLDVWIPIPAGKYPYAIALTGTWNLAVMGIEV